MAMPKPIGGAEDEMENKRTRAVCNDTEHDYFALTKKGGELILVCRKCADVKKVE